MKPSRSLAKDYDALWTLERMGRVIQAAARSGAAIEFNDRYHIPSARFLKLAKKAGLKFTFGTNHTDPNLGGEESGLDFWRPKPEGQKPIRQKLPK